MPMYYNTRKAKPVQIEGTVWYIRQPSASEQIELMDKLDTLVDNVRTLPEIVIWLVSVLVEKVEGLTDEEGSQVAYPGSLTADELCQGLTVGNLRAIVDAVLRMGKQSEDAKKNS